MVDTDAINGLKTAVGMMIIHQQMNYLIKQFKP